MFETADNQDVDFIHLIGYIRVKEQMLHCFDTFMPMPKLLQVVFRSFPSYSAGFRV